MQMRGIVLALLLAAAPVAARKAPPPPPPPPPPSMQAPAPVQAAPTGPARVDANLGTLPADQQAAMQQCLMEGARQAGAGGATTMRFDGVDSVEPGNGGWRFAYRATLANAGGTKPISVYCRATSSKVVEYRRNR